MMKSKRKIRIWQVLLWAALFVGITASLGISLYSIHKKIPSTIYFLAQEEQDMNLGLPATGEIKAASGGQISNIPKGAVTIDLSGPVKMRTGGEQEYDMEVKLFGVLPLKQVDIRVIENRKLIPMGTPVGLYMHSKGILVVGVAEFETDTGELVSPAKNLLYSGDYVKAVGGVAVHEKQELMGKIEESNGKMITLTVERAGREQDIRIEPKRNTLGEYKVGIWLRDNVQGVGTLTFLDSQGNFGALGHGIADIDTGTILDVDSGTLYETSIVNVRKGENGTPGEMTGRIVYDDSHILGEIYSNDDRGVFGSCSEKLWEKAEQEACPIGLRQDIVPGPAQIICTIGEETRTYQVEVTRLYPNSDNINRGIELEVTDPELLRLTGGIIQGMSGSPILQNGKLIGAVTHVLVNSPERGYGIFIENMLEASMSAH